MADPSLSVADIEAAERLLGIAYTARERAQMVGNLAGQIASAVDRRKVELANSVPMASRFDPRLPGFEMPVAHGLVGSQPGAPLPASDADIAFASLPQLGTWIASRTITSRRLTEIYLDRIERLNPQLYCFATVTRELALAEANAMDRLIAEGTYLGPPRFEGFVVVA